MVLLHVARNVSTSPDCVNIVFKGVEVLLVIWVEGIDLSLESDSQMH